MAEQQGGQRGLRVGTVLGAPVVVMPSWFVIAALVTLLYTPQVQGRFPSLGSAAVLVAFGSALLLLLSVFLHEVAHAVAARAVGTAPTLIALDLWGGHTAFSEELPTPGRSAFVSLVGPATNGLIAVLAGVAGGFVDPDGIAAAMLLGLQFTNAFVAVFNALPGLPLDGGRALEALIWKITGQRSTGTLAAGWIGRGVAALLVLWVLRGLLTGGPTDLTSTLWLLLVAGLLWQGATQAIRLARWRRRAPTVTVAGLLRPAVVVPATTSLSQVASAAVQAGVADVVLLGPDGRPVAVLDRAAAESVPPQRAGVVAAAAVSRALAPEAVLAVDLAGDDLIGRLRAAPHPEYAVVDGAGAVVGLLSWDAVAASVARG